jgi:hypothetical protein
MPFQDIPRRGLSPLWIIAIFLSFSETILGIAVTQTSGGIRVALTVFVIVFPAIVCGVFFLILWNRPYVFYPPAEFSGDVGVQAYVEAMHYRGAAQIPQFVDSRTVYQKLSTAAGSTDTTVSGPAVVSLRALLTVCGTTPDAFATAAQLLTQLQQVMAAAIIDDAKLKTLNDAITALKLN